MIVFGVREEFLDINPLIPVVDDRYQPIVIALDIENRIRVGKVRSRQHGAYGMDVLKFRLLEDFSPARECLCGIGMAGGIAIQRFLLDDVHLEANIAKCYMCVKRGFTQPPIFSLSSTTLRL